METLYSDPTTIYNSIWSFLEKGVVDRNSPFHTPTLITLESDHAAARTLVLRGVDKTAQTLRFHTDKRSKKIEQINVNQDALVHIYS